MRSFIICTLHLIKSRRIRWSGHVARIGEIINVHNILVGKPQGKVLLGGPRWEDNIRSIICVRYQFFVGLKPL